LTIEFLSVASHPTEQEQQWRLHVKVQER